MDLKSKKIVVTGGAGFLGSHVIEELLAHGVPREHITAPRHAEHDLRVRAECDAVVKGQDVVIHLAANVGGIGFNLNHQSDIFYDNLMMGTNMMEAARVAGVEKFVAIATVCSYPKFTPVPFKEDDLWNGYPEETNAPYGLAKKMMLVQAQVYREKYGFDAIVLFPVNMYGPRDNFDLEDSHVIPALVRKVVEAKRAGAAFIEAWGTGTPTREFIYVEDAARGIVAATEKYDKADPVNIGSGSDIAIKDLVALICELADYHGEVRWDPSHPDGQPRRMLDVSRAAREFDFHATMPLREGIKKTIEWYEAQTGSA